VEPVVPTSPAVPVHPSASGMHAVTDFVLDTLGDRELDETATLG
jgi:hypothetical protein